MTVASSFGAFPPGRYLQFVAIQAAPAARAGIVFSPHRRTYIQLRSQMRNQVRAGRPP